MSKESLIRPGRACLTTVALILFGTAPRVSAQTALQGQLLLRPVTPGDIARYNLPSSTEISSGCQAGSIANIGVGAPAYLEAEVNLAVPSSNIVSVTWKLTNQPAGSKAILQPSPLGANVPIYEPSDALAFQVVDRRLLRPDLVGKYTVIASITTGDGLTTNLTQAVRVSTYMGINTCALCHGGIPDGTVLSWQTTAHASIFTKGIEGNLGIGPTYNQSCLQCHTVGYDTNSAAANGGFDDVMATNGWKFPSAITNGNWAAMPAELKNLANVQCENCHGPGSEHATHLGNTNMISVSLSSGDCNQCHDAPTQHVKGTEWYVSAHAVTTRDASGPGREGCVGCHTAGGFIGRINGDSTTNTTYSAIGCQTCHEPHGQSSPATNPHLLRTLVPVTLMDGTTVTNAGLGTLCMTCHHSQQNAATYASSTPGSADFGPHNGVQADMLEGVNGFTYGQTIPSSGHGKVVANTCVTCHMQAVDATSPAYLHGGDHTFKVMCDPGGDGVIVNLVSACQQCHASEFTATSGWNVPVQDYDGDGVVDGLQDEVQNLLNKLSTLLPPDNTVKSSLNIDSTWTTSQLEAAYNWLFVNNDASLGAHNVAYAVGLLKASIANLTGDANNDGLPDTWQIQYFGSINSADAAPNAVPAGDGVPNWLKYSLGLDPTKPGVNVRDGVVWSNGVGVANSGDTNTVQIYTAAEISFDTETGKSYQIQSVSSVSGGWQNVGGPIQGTGSSISYVTPTRQNLQQFYRVVHTP